MEQQTFSFYSNATNINFRQKMQCILLMKIFAFFFLWINLGFTILSSKQCVSESGLKTLELTHYTF
jgi:hypothetical protein